MTPQRIPLKDQLFTGEKIELITGEIQRVHPVFRTDEFFGAVVARFPELELKPLFQAATANLNPWTEAKVDTQSPDRGPLLLMSGELDHTVPWAIVNASYKQQQDNQGVTEIERIPGRGHALIIDSGWREVADKALAFVKRFT